MTRSEKLNKLGNAVKAYRGSYDPASKRWIFPPNPAKRKNIVAWLTRLGRNHAQIESDALKIDGFKNRTEFYQWLASVEKGDE